MSSLIMGFLIISLRNSAVCILQTMKRENTKKKKKIYLIQGLYPSIILVNWLAISIMQLRENNTKMKISNER